MIKINAKSLEYILKVTPPEQNVMLVGRHGIGKSKILEDYYTKQNIKVVTLFLGQMSDPGDLIGLPQKMKRQGRQIFCFHIGFQQTIRPSSCFLMN